MNLIKHANQSIPKPAGIVEIKHKDGNTQDIIDVILMADRQVGLKMCEFAKAFDPSINSLRDLWTFTHNNIRYIGDKKGKERVKDPTVTWADKSGDCKSFSLFIGSILKCLGIKYRYRFTSYSGSDPTHVYVIATIGSSNVIMDATIDQFNYETPYKKKWDKMTEIAYVHGNPAPAIHTRRAKPTPAERIADAPRLTIAKSYIDYSNLSEGQLTLRLLDEQVKLLTSYYGDPGGTYQKARNIIHSASSDPHRLAGHIGYIDETLYPLMSYIEWAKSRSKPAGIQGARIAGFAEDREAVLEQCRHANNVYVKFLKDNQPPKQKNGSPWELRDLKKTIKTCQDQVLFMDLYNKHLEGSSPHVLYEFVPDNERNSLPNRASFKTENHRLANSSMARYSQLDRTNIVLWERNGIMRASAKKGLTDISPEAFINDWKKGSSGINTAHIGIAFPALLVIITDALIAAGALLSGIQLAKATFASEVKGYSSKQFGPEDGDWSGAGSQSGFDFNSILPFAAAAAGGYLLLKK